MIDEEGLKLEARLAIHDLLMAHLFKAFYRVARYTPDQVAEALARYEQDALAWTIPGIDPAQADLAAAELQDALRHQLAVLRGVLGVPPGDRGG